MVQYAPTAVVQTVGGTTIGHLKNVRWGYRPRPIIEYDISGGDPALLEPGEIEYIVTAAWGWVSDVIRTAIKNTKVAIVISMRGTGGGMSRHTLNGAILSYENSVERNRVIMVNVTGPYQSETINTHP